MVLVPGDVSVSVNFSVRVSVSVNIGVNVSFSVNKLVHVSISFIVSDKVR